MTDLIARARKEWLEVHKSPEDAPDGEAWHYTLPCPTAVVAALLDLLREAKLSSVDTRPAEAAIEKALEASHD